MTSKATKCSKGQFYRRGYVRQFPRIKRVQPTCVKRSKRSSKVRSKRSSKVASKRKSKRVCNSKFVAKYSKQCGENMRWRRGHCRPSSDTYVPGQCVKIAKSNLGPYMVTTPSIQPQVLAPSSSTTFIPTSLPQQQPQVLTKSLPSTPTLFVPQQKRTTVTQPQLPLQTIKTIQKPTISPVLTSVPAAAPYQEEIIIITGPPQAAF